MSVTAIVGGNWGDEGKGKMTDLLAKEAAYVVRFQGGNNAGHTIINQYGKFQLHLLPSGVFYQNATNILAPGVALNIKGFLDEYEHLILRGVPAPQIKISHRAQVILPQHVLLDQYEEARLGTKKFGSTQSGIAPFYADKYNKIGIQVNDLFTPDRLLDKLERNIEKKNVLLQHFYKQPLLEAEKICDDLIQLGDRIKPFVCDTTKVLNEAIAQQKNILMEGQLGALKDPDHGIYPMTTSSSPLAGFSAIGAGIPAASIQHVVTVVKAYSSCVGAGPFVSEIFGEEAAQLRHLGGDNGEYGATTGRPRRMGWFDVVATRYGCTLQGTTEVALSLLDVLGYLENIPVCTAYQINDTITQAFPVTHELDLAKPVIETLPG